jgi:hypothetical protein
MFSPHFGILGGSAEWEPQMRPEGQKSIGEIERGLRPTEFEELLRRNSGADPNPDVSRVGTLPRAEEFQPPRPLTMAEIVEMQQPGGRERVEAQLRMERAAQDELMRRAFRVMRPRDDGADLPMAPGGSFGRPPGFGGY